MPTLTPAPNAEIKSNNNHSAINNLPTLTPKPTVGHMNQE